MKNKSLWLDGCENANYTSLQEDITCDVLIIGGGITGLSILYNLKDTNLNVVLMESDLIGHATTGHTTGKINYLQEHVYSDIQNKYGFNTAKLYYDSQIEAIEHLINIIKKENIACDLEQVTSFVYTNKDEEIEKLKYESTLLKRFGAPVKEDEHNHPFINSKYALSVSNTYVFHPLKYLKALKQICLKKGKPIYEKTPIIDIQKNNNEYLCFTQENQIRTKKIILACHYPYFLFPYFLPLRTSIEKSYIAVSPALNKKETFINCSKPIVSLRYYQDNLIYLTNTSQSCDNINEEKNYQKLVKQMQNLNLDVTYLWKNDDLLTVDKIPYIGYIKKNDKSILMATGYNTWGMSNSSLAGLVISDLIQGKKNKYENLVTPKRVIKLQNIKELAKNSWYSFKGYVKGYAKKEPENKFCPHMGCKLIYNKVDETWDCPCHASRFTKEGKCIKAPSIKDIN